MTAWPSSPSTGRSCSTSISGAGSSAAAPELIAKELGAVVRNPDIRAIVLDVDSPGGQVTGCGELASLIKLRAESGKPIVAYATGTCASAACWIASACDEIFVSDTSAVGSIGCVASIRDYSAAMEKAGIRDFEFVSSVSPAKRSDPATEEGAARIQAEVDELGRIFLEAVAENRRVSASDARAAFGGGGVFIGAAAVEAGLADGTGTLEDVIAEFGNGAATVAATGDDDMLKRGAKALTKASAKISAKAQAKAEDTEEDLEDEEELDDEDTDADGDDEETDASTEEEEDSAEGDDDEEEAEDDEEKPVTKRASGERGRIAAILNSRHAKGRSALAKHLALNTGMSAKAAAGILKAAPKATGTAPAKASANGFDKAMKALGNPKVGTGKAAARTEADEDIARIVAAAKEIGRA